MNTRLRQWNWLQTRRGQPFRSHAAFLRVFCAAAPFLSFLVILLSFKMAADRYVTTPGFLISLPERIVTASDIAPSMVLFAAASPEPSAPNGVMRIYFDDVCYKFPQDASNFSVQLSRKASFSREASLLILSDRNVPSGELLALGQIARKCGITKIQIAAKAAEGRDG